VALGEVGVLQLADTGWSVKHGRDLIEAQMAASQRGATDERCGMAGIGLAQTATLGVEGFEGEAIVSNPVGQDLLMSATTGFAYGLNAPKPTPAADNAALFASVLSSSEKLPGGLQALSCYLLRGGVVLARHGVEAFTIITAPNDNGETLWQQALGINAAAWVAARAGVEAMWNQVVLRAK
jgi:hypothetical protein